MRRINFAILASGRGTIIPVLLKNIKEKNLDEGSIIVQKKCSVEPNDTPESLKQKVQSLEPFAFAEALEKEIKNDLNH